MITKIRFKFELIYYYLKRNWLFVLLGLVTGFLLINFRFQLLALYRRINPQIQKIGIEGQYTVYTLPQSISEKFSYGLTTNSESGKPDLSPIVSNLDIRQDNTQYIFTLNPNIYWHSGRKLAAQDITYKIPGLSIEAVSNEQLIITTEKPYAPILSTLSQPLIKKNFNGLGTYRVHKYDYQDGYLKSLHLKSDKDDLKYYFYQNENDLLNAFKIGEVDQIQLSYVPENFNEWPNITINKNINTSEKYLAIFINTDKFSNKQLRQALAYATPKTSELNERALSPISPLSWAYNSDVKDYSFNSQKAKEFFEKNKIESINLVYNDRRLLTIAENIKNTWQDTLNIKVTTNVTTQVDTENFDTILAYGSIPTDPDQYLFWHSTQNKTNLTKLNNPRIDKLLEEGRQTFDQQERKNIYQEFQKNLLEECPVIFLKYPIIYTISRTN